MFKELETFLKNYRKTSKAVQKTLKSNNEYKVFLVSYNTDTCQFLNGFMYGLITLHHPYETIDYFNVYRLNIILNNILKNKYFVNPFVNVQQEVDFDLNSILDESLQEIIQHLELTEFFQKTAYLFQLIVNTINETQTQSFDKKLLFNCIVSWTIYLLINDRLENSVANDIETVDLWIQHLTKLTAIISDQLKILLTNHFGLLMEYITFVVLSIQ